MKRAAFALVLAGLMAMLLWGCGGEQKAENTNQTSGGETREEASTTDANLIPLDEAQRAPDWDLQKVGGGTLSLSELRGRVVILDFWDTWCPPCKKEIPGFIELQDTYGDQGLTIVGAAFGRDGREAVEKFAREWEMNYPVVLATQRTSSMYGGIRSIPTTFIIDREGLVRAVHVGFAPKERFEAEVRALL